MIDKIAFLQQALSGLQRAQPIAPAKPDAPADQGAAAAGDMPAATGSVRDAVFEQRVRQRVARLDPEDPQRRRRALRLVVEAGLLKEFGDSLDADPAFHALVDQVVSTMHDDPAMSAAIDLALKDLLP